jgi:hypothetical protein
MFIGDKALLICAPVVKAPLEFIVPVFVPALSTIVHATLDLAKSAVAVPLT